MSARDSIDLTEANLRAQEAADDDSAERVPPDPTAGKVSFHASMRYCSDCDRMRPWTHDHETINVRRY